MRLTQTTPQFAMIDWPERLSLPNLQNKRAYIETNWNQDIKGRFIRIVIDALSITIPREVLIRSALLLGDDKEQEKLIPSISVPVRRYEKRIKLRLTHDMKQGDELEIPVGFDVRLDSGTEISILNNSFLS